MSDRRSATSDGRSDREPPSRRIRGLLSRRTYLKALGAYGAGRTTLGVAGHAAAAEYTTYEVGAGETFERRLGDDETFENALIDVSADGAGVDIRAAGNDWTIRNVGIRGKYDGEVTGSIFTLRVNEGGEGAFENVYLGDGARDGGYGGVFVPTTHAGDLTIRRCHVAEWPDNGIYASAPGREKRDGERGTVRIVDSYARNNNVAGFRLGTDGSSVERSVVHVDEDVPNKDGGGVNARGIWVKEGGSVDIENCDVLLAHPDGSYCIWEGDDDSVSLARVIESEVEARGKTDRFRGNVETENVGDDPDVTPPDGVPESAEAAARGGRSDTDADAGGSNGSDDADDASDDSSDQDESDEATEDDRSNGSDRTKTVEFVGGNSDDGEYLEYAVETSDALDGKKSTEDGEEADGRRAEGATGGSGDGFTFEGAIESLDATLTGAEGQHRASVVITNEGNESRIRFRGGNDEERLRYELAVTGSVDATSSVEERSGVSGSRARGATGGGADELVFTGEISSLRAALPPDAGRFLVKVKPGR